MVMQDKAVSVRAMDEVSLDRARDLAAEDTRVVPVELIEALREASRASEAQNDARAKGPRLVTAADDRASALDARATVSFERID